MGYELGDRSYVCWRHIIEGYPIAIIFQVKLSTRMKQTKETQKLRYTAKLALKPGPSVAGTDLSLKNCIAIIESGERTASSHSEKYNWAIKRLC